MYLLALVFESPWRTPKEQRLKYYQNAEIFTYAFLKVSHKIKLLGVLETIFNYKIVIRR